MRDFILSDIASGVKAPFSKRSLEHLNEMTSELSSFTMELASDYSSFGTELVIIKGCVISGSQPGAITWTAGIIYYNGDFYRVDAGGTTINVGEVAVWNYSDTYISGDPATYSDSNTYNFHRIRKMTLTSAVSGSGLKDYNAVKLYTKTITNGFGSVTLVPPVSAATINNQVMIRKGNIIYYWMEIDVTTTSTDIFRLSIPISSSNNTPVIDAIFYDVDKQNNGSVCNAGTSSVSGNLANGRTRAQFNGFLDVICHRVTATTSHSISVQGSYFTRVPYSDY